VCPYFKISEARIWAHNSRFQKQGCGPIIHGSRSKDVGPEFKVTEAHHFKVPEARMWAQSSRFQKQGCGVVDPQFQGVEARMYCRPIILGSRIKDVEWAHTPRTQLEGCGVWIYSLHHSHKTQIRVLNYQKKNCTASFPISTFIYL
jgi:hypothetical protein